MVRKRSGLSLKVLIFTITAAWTQWSGMQNSVVVPLVVKSRSSCQLSPSYLWPVCGRGWVHLGTSVAAQAADTAECRSQLPNPPNRLRNSFPQLACVISAASQIICFLQTCEDDPLHSIIGLCDHIFTFL